MFVEVALVDDKQSTVRKSRTKHVTAVNTGTPPVLCVWNESMSLYAQFLCCWLVGAGGGGIAVALAFSQQRISFLFWRSLARTRNSPLSKVISGLRVRVFQNRMLLAPKFIGQVCCLFSFWWREFEPLDVSKTGNRAAQL